MKTRFRSRLVWVLSACQLAALSTLTAATPAPERLLGQDTLAVFTAPNWSNAVHTFSQWPISRFCKDPAMKPFREKFVTRFKEDLLQPLERELGIQFAEYAGLAQGQITLAITQNQLGQTKDGEPGVLFLLDAGSKSNELQKVLAKLKSKWIDGGKSVRAQTLRNVEFTGYLFSPEDLGKSLSKAFPDPEEGLEKLEPEKPDKAPKKIEWLAGQSESLLILGNVQADIEKVLARQSGGQVASLSDQAQFAPQQKSLFRQSLTYGWINLKSIVELIRKVTSEEKKEKNSGNPLESSPDTWIAALGLNQVESLAWSVDSHANGYGLSAALRAPGLPRKGLLSLLSLEAKESGPPPFVPAEVAKFSRLRLDLKKTWATLEKTLTELTPQMAGILTMLIDNAGKEEDPNFDLRKNLIANLGDDLISVDYISQMHSLQSLASPPTLFLLGSPRAQELAAAFKSLSSLLPQKSGKLKDREFLGRTVYTLALPAETKPDGKSVPRSLTYAASGSYVAISTDTALVEEFLRGNSPKPLRDTPGLAEATQQVGGMSSGFFSYENDRLSMQAAFNALKKDSATLDTLFQASPLSSRLNVDETSKALKDWLDFSLLPSFEQVEKYFHYSVYGIRVDDQGFSFKSFSPKPPRL